jgi:hypothetical protein
VPLRELISRLFGRGTKPSRQAAESAAPSRSVVSARVGEPPHPREQARRQPVVVGIDFGTSGTKVAYRDFADPRRTPCLVDFGTREAGYCRFSLPSVVRISTEHVFVGEDALARDGRSSKLIRSPKMRLLNGAAGTAGPVPSEYELASTLIIAEAIRRTRSAIAGALAGEEPGLLFNLDVPVSDLDSGTASDAFGRLLALAIRFSDELPSAPLLDQAMEAWQDIAGQATPIGDLVPEAQAVMQGISRLASVKPDRLHAVLDVGAGTVDMGIFKLVSILDGDRMPFWAADTHPQGCDAIDEDLCGRLALSSDMVDRVRTAKAKVVRTGREASVGRARLTPRVLAESATWFSASCWPAYSRMFGNAYTKQKNTDEWAVMSTVVVGGGSLLPALVDDLSRSPRDFVTVSRERLGGRLICRVVGASERPPDDHELPFLIPAVGLAHIKPELPEFVPPSRVPPDPGRHRGPSGAYDYEIGDT